MRKCVVVRKVLVKLGVGKNSWGNPVIKSRFVADTCVYCNYLGRNVINFDDEVAVTIGAVAILPSTENKYLFVFLTCN